MFQFDYRTKHFPDADDAQRKSLMYSPSPVPPHPSPVHSDALTDCNVRHTVLTGSSFPFSYFVSSHPVISGGRTRTPSVEVEQPAMANPAAGPRYFALASQHTSPLHSPFSSSLSSPAVTPKPGMRETQSVNSFKTGKSIYSYAKRARMDARNERRREERARARARGRPRASEPGAAATARARAAARIGAIGLGRGLGPGLGRKRKRAQELGESRVSGEVAETGQSVAAAAGLPGPGTSDFAARSLSSLSNATDTRRASVRVVARATVPGASISLGLSGLSNQSVAGGTPKDRTSTVPGGLASLDAKESEDLGTENETEEDEDYAPAKVPRPYTGAGAGAVRPITSSSPNTPGIAPSLPLAASVPQTTFRASLTSSSRGRRPRIPHSSRASNHSNNNPDMTDMAAFGFWTDAKKIVLFMHYIEDPEPSVEARRAMADEVGLDTSQVSKFMSRTRSEIARGTMSERLKRLLRVARERIEAKLVGGTESGATGDAVVHPPQGLADSSGSGSDVDAEFEVEVGSAIASARGSTILQATQVPSHPELNGRHGKGEEECSSWRMDVDAASSEVALALLSLSTSHGPSCSSSVISTSLACDAMTPDAAAFPSSSPKSKVVADYVGCMRTPSVLLLPAPLPCVSSPISVQPHFLSQPNTSSHSPEPDLMSSEATSTCASGYSTMTFPSPISLETALTVPSPDRTHELLHLQGKQHDKSSATESKFDTGADTANSIIGLDPSSTHGGFRLSLVPPVYTTEAEMESIPNSLPSSQNQKAAHSTLLYPLSSDAQIQTQPQSQTQSISLQVPMGPQSNTHLSHIYSHSYPQQQPCAKSSSPSPTTTHFSSSPSSTFNNSNYNNSGAFESPAPGLQPIEHPLFRIPLIRTTPIVPHSTKTESVEAVQAPGPPTTFVNAFVHSPRPGRSPISSADLRAWAETGHFLPSPSLSGSTAVGSDSVASSAPATISPLPQHQYLAYLKSQQQQRTSSSRIRAEERISFGHSSKPNTCWEKRVPSEASTIVAPIWGRQAASSYIEQGQSHSHSQPRSRHQAAMRSQYSGYGGLAESGSESMFAVEMIPRAHHLQHYRHAVTPVSSPAAPRKRKPQTLKSTALPSLSMYLPQSSSFQQPSHQHSPGRSHLIPPSSLAGSPDSVTETSAFAPAFQTPLPIEQRDSSRDAQNTVVGQSQHPIYPSTSSFENNHRTMHSKSNYPH